MFRPTEEVKVWRLCDLHNHTTPNEQCDTAWDPEAFVRSCVDAGLDVVAVTDHDHCEHLSDALIAAESTDLTVIPGVELSTDHGHVLALAPDEGGCATIEDFCKRLGVVPGQQIKFDTIVGAFESKHDAERHFSDEIVLLGAHVDAPASMLSSQNTRSLELQLEAAGRLHALEVSSKAKLEEWSAAGVKQSNRKFTLLQGSDTHDPDARIARGTWIYLPEVTTNHLRHAFALPESSVVMSDQCPPTQQWAVEYIEFDGGHHSGERFLFAERANAVIGPPNAGKSLLVDAFKFVFGIECDIEEVEKITQARMKGTMPKGTVVRVGVRTPAGSSVIQRTVGGSDRPSPPFTPIIFSQTELTRRSIAGEPAVQLLDIRCPEAEAAKSTIRDKAAAVAELFEVLCEQAEQCHELRASVENPEDGLAATKKEIADLSGHESVATKAMNLEKVAGWQSETASAIEDWLQGVLTEPVSIPAAPDLSESEVDLSPLLPVDSVTQAAKVARESVEKSVAAARRDLEASLKSATEQLAAQREAADDELEQQGFDKGSELLDAVRQLQKRLGRLQQDKTTLDGLELAVNEGLVELRAALTGVEEARSSLTAVRKAGCTRVNDSMHSFFAKLDPTGVTTRLESLFDDLKTGTNMHPPTRKRALDGLNRMRFLERAVRELQGRPLDDDEQHGEQDRVVSEALERDKRAQIAELACCYPGDSLDLLWKEEKPPRTFSGLTEGLRALAIKEISFAASDLPVIRTRTGRCRLQSSSFRRAKPSYSDISTDRLFRYALERLASGSSIRRGSGRRAIAVHETDETQICQRCDRPVATPDYETFERMHYVCFHYEFEHGDLDVDQECTAGGCPSRPHGETPAPKGSYEPGQFARMGVVFFDERAGRALVRLPNDSKTTVDFDALTVDGGIVHFVRDPSGERAYCGECDWEVTASSRVAAQELYRNHHLRSHAS